MLIEDEESLQMYVEESLEHMANIENNLLAIEQGGDNADPEIVNEVFRAAHSIKGGAGLMGLHNIKELSHKVENVLGMVRDHRITPDSSIISIVLAAFDKLYEMVNNIKESESFDIAEEVVSLTGLATASLPASRKPDMASMVNILREEGGEPAFQLARFDIDEATKGGSYVYLVAWDLMMDVHDQEHSLMDMMRSVTSSGDILETKIEIESVGTLDEATPAKIPLLILYASRIGQDIIPSLFNVGSEQVRPVTEAMIVPVADEGAGRDESLMLEPEEPEPDLSPDGASTDELDDSGILSGDESLVRADAAEADEGLMAQSEDEQVAAELKGIQQIKAAMSQKTLRVDVKLLDTLMVLAGEMVLSRNQLLQSISRDETKVIASAAQRINMVTSELQDVIMRTRMQSIGNIFNKFPRLVRDMSQGLGKKVELTLEGTDVELDKTIIEAISEPLTHLIRNAVDHGIEPPGRRANLGKNPIGKIHLAALHEAGQVSIEITDDGKGIDPDVIVSSALQKGLITKRQVGGMSRTEKVDLILLPGFSTSERVTDISGRGVGMDVVKTNLEKLGGTMEINSEAGQYTTISIKLPLTLAIIPSQLVAVGNEKFAIPQVNLDELLRIPADQVKERIEKVGDAAVVRLRGRLLPLVDLAEILGIEKMFVHPENGGHYPERRTRVADRRSLRHAPPGESDDEPDTDETAESESESESESRKIAESRRTGEDRRFHATSAVNIAVVFQGNIRYGLVVDRLLDSEEIVVKPLGSHLKQCQEFTGATIMGDGRVALIIDVAGVAYSAELNTLEISEKVQKHAQEEAEQGGAETEEATSLLLFNNGPEEQFAVSLALVERIESIQTSVIEYVGGRKVMQYRGGALPLFSLGEIANVKPLPDTKELEVIVFQVGGREIGLMVNPPVDSIDVPIHIDEKALKQPGIMGSAIINHQTTLIVDIFEAVKTLYPDWLDGLTHKQVITGSKGTLLFAEDSDFFRRQVKGFLEDGGYRVIEAKDGKDAWDLLQQNAEMVDLIITDIEMPNMDGFQLTEKIKSSDAYRHFSVIALTSLAGEEDIVKGKQVGIADYQIKMDREKLIDSVERHLAKGRA
ncbi:MAG: chemotaxis protein CheW [Thermodesulfobacteriota bacterium]|nr:chemotaxis protein CheW [Thermodesulfobacteriota bacterium]